MQEVYPELTSKKNNSVNIKKYKTKRELNLGIFLFAIVFIYLLVTIVLYFTGDRISVYEVREGSIVKDNSYTGLIIRNEMTVNAESSGYVSYYQAENSKIKRGMNVYAVSPEKLDTTSGTSSAQENSTNGQSIMVNPEVRSAITLQTQNFVEGYDSNEFNSVYSLRSEITTALQNEFSATRTEQLDAVIAASGLSVSSYAAQQDGIIAFSIDGYEDLTVDTFTPSDFDKTKYEVSALSDQTKIQAGEPVYRMITSEDWSVIVPFTKETAVKLKHENVSGMKVRIDKDSETLWGKLTIVERQGNYYGQLDFDNSMIRYAEERFLNVELIMEDESGLKIPKSSVVNEKFYVIPKEYLTTGGNSSANGVMLAKENGSTVFHTVNIYDISENGDVCISKNDLKEGSILVKPESSDTFTVGKTKNLQGVYNINKGYAVFKKVSVLCENDEYYIVKEGESYGLSNYDHIVQEGAGINSDDVVFQ